MAKKQIDPLKAKQKRQKIVLGVLGVLFLGLLAFQVPKLMKQLNPPTGPPIVNPRKPADGSSWHGNADARRTHTARCVRGPDGRNDVRLTRLGSRSAGAGRPARFLLPLRQQGSICAAAERGRWLDRRQLRRRHHGSCRRVRYRRSRDPRHCRPRSRPWQRDHLREWDALQRAHGDGLPAAHRERSSGRAAFHLVSLTSHSAKISIVGGEYSNGSRTVTLKEGKPVTLMNAADGTRYKLILMPPGTEVPTTDAGLEYEPDDGHASAGNALAEAQPEVGRVERRRHARERACRVGAVSHNDRDHLQLVPVRRRIEIEVRVQTVGLSVRAGGREAWIAGRRRDVRRAGGHRRYERLGGTGLCMFCV